MSGDEGVPQQPARAPALQGGEMEKLKQLVEIVNGVGENVWAVVMVVLAIGLVLKGQSAAGGTLITGALALFQRK